MEKRDFMTIIKNKFGFTQEQLKEFEAIMEDAIEQAKTFYSGAIKEAILDGNETTKDIECLACHQVGKRFFISMTSINFANDTLGFEVKEVEEEIYYATLDKMKQIDEEEVDYTVLN